MTASLYERCAGWDPVARMQYLDLFTWLRGDILVKADKMTMANSLELRVPFLDPEVFKVASRLPYREKINGQPTKRTTKYALRKALNPLCRRMFCTGPSSASRCPSGIGLSTGYCTTGPARCSPPHRQGT